MDTSGEQVYAAEAPGPALPTDIEHRPGGTPPKPGELGYREWCISQIEAGRCSCPGCGGVLTDPAASPGGWGFCRRCRCAHKVGLVNRQRYAARVPDYDNCPQAKRELADERREQERQARGRLAAEELGPQR